MKINSKESMIPSIRKEHNTSRDNQGFTLVELILVVSIIAVLASLAINGLYTMRDTARESRAAEEIRGLEKDIIAYAAERGEYPPDLDAVNQAGLLDPWGHPYEYKKIPIRTFSGDPLNTDFDIYSKGRDGVSPDPSIALPGCIDDVIRGSDGGYAGLADRYGT